MDKAGVRREYERVCDGLDGILAEHGYERNGACYTVRRESTETLCFFCHFGVTCVILSHLLSISPMLLWHGLVAAPASVTGVITEERRQGIASFRMYCYGDTSHLSLEGMPENLSARFAEIYSDQSQRHD